MVSAKENNLYKIMLKKIQCTPEEGKLLTGVRFKTTVNADSTKSLRDFHGDTNSSTLTVKNCCRVVGPNRVPFCADVLQVLARAMNQPLRHMWCLLHLSFLLLTAATQDATGSVVTGQRPGAVPGEPQGGLSNDTHTQTKDTMLFLLLRPAPKEHEIARQQVSKTLPYWLPSLLSLSFP